MERRSCSNRNSPSVGEHEDVAFQAVVEDVRKGQPMPLKDGVTVSAFVERADVAEERTIFPALACRKSMVGLRLASSSAAALPSPEPCSIRYALIFSPSGVSSVRSS